MPTCNYIVMLVMFNVYVQRHSSRRCVRMLWPLCSAHVALQEAAMEVIADGVVDKALLLLRLAARLVLEHNILVPSAQRERMFR